MMGFIRNNRVPLVAVTLIVIFFLFLYISNYYLIPKMETPLNDSLGGFLRPGTIISLMAILVFQILFMQLLAGLKIQEIVVLNKPTPTLVFLIIFSSIMLLFQLFEDTRFESARPDNIKGAGQIVELALGAYIEEIIYRGFFFLILYKWASTKLSRIPRQLIAFIFIILSSLLFGVGHIFYYSILNDDLNWTHLISPTIGGIIFCVIYLNTKNLAITAVLHFFINYRFVDFPITNTGQSLSFGFVALVSIFLCTIGHVIYGSKDVKYIG